MSDIIDYSEECDYNALKNGIKMVLLKYFECHDYGSRSEFFQDGYEAQHAIDDIHDLIGDI